LGLKPNFRKTSGLEHNTHFTLANFWLGKEVHQFVASVVSSTQMQLSVSFHTQLVGKKLVGGIT
jgi:hypothetical protein